MVSAETRKQNQYEGADVGAERESSQLVALRPMQFRLKQDEIFALDSQT